MGGETFDKLTSPDIPESAKRVPRDIRQVLTVTMYELLRYSRRKRLMAMVIIIAVVVTIMLGVLPILGVSYPDDPYEFARRFAEWITIIVVLCATFFASDSIVAEYEHKTGYLLFPNPVKRWVLYLGKFLASIAVSFALLGMYYGAIYGSSLVVTRSVPIELTFSFSFSLLYLMSAAAIAFLISSFMKSTTISSVLTFFLFFLIFPIVEFVLSLARVKPQFSISFSGGIISNVLAGPYPDAYPKDQIIETPGFTLVQYIPDVSVSLIVMASYLVAAYFAGMFLFLRREMVG